jgi:flagellar basal-body rod protein FlgB
VFSKLQVYGSALDATTLRHKSTLKNIANADTPNYKSERVSFEDILKNELQEKTKFVPFRTDPRHFGLNDKGTINPRIFYENNSVIHNNGNNVDLDYEMSQLATNQIQYQALVERTNGFFRSMKTVIGGN